jgi:Domain of unknown function (DUF1840)
MLYKFRSKAAGDVIMLGPNGDQMLRLLGREPAPKGIIEVAHMAAAIAALQAAVQADEAARAEAERDGRSSANKEVALRQRVWPMVDMMTRSAQADEPIVWGV